jgi:hypothetical protein
MISLVVHNVDRLKIVAAWPNIVGQAIQVLNTLSLDIYFILLEAHIRFKIDKFNGAVRRWQRNLFPVIGTTQSTEQQRSKFVGS